MKNKRVEWIILTFAAFFIFGCASKPKQVPYDYAKNENANGTASVYVNNAQFSTTSGLYHASYTNPYWVIDFEGIELPAPGQKTIWEPLILPAGRPLDIRISFHFRGKYNYGTKHDNNIRRGIFKCPPLENGKKYKLWVEPSQNNNGIVNSAGQLGGGRLILTDAKIKKLKYVFGNTKSPGYKQIYVQEIPPLQ